MPTPEQWRDRLEARLTERWVRARTGMGIYDAYFEGDHQLAFATAAYREAFGEGHEGSMQSRTWRTPKP
jgi:hypothetical protein